MIEESTKSMEFIVDRGLRDKMMEHYEVLDKVKELLLIDGVEMATTEQVANFYEVGRETIKALVFDNRDEVESDGMKKLSGRETKELLVGCQKQLTNFRGYFESDGIRFANNSNLLFSRRAILRVGMLLRDSEVAKEVRTQLLNIEEKTSNETKTIDIDEEQSLATSLGMAIASGNIEAVAIASANMMAFKNRHIAKLETDNKALAGQVLEWKDRDKINAGIRKLALMAHNGFAQTWNELYRNLKYGYHIDLTLRGGKPYISHIKESEWSDVLKVFSAMCEEYGYSPSDMIGQSAIG